MIKATDFKFMIRWMKNAYTGATTTKISLENIYITSFFHERFQL